MITILWGAIHHIHRLYYHDRLVALVMCVFISFHTRSLFKKKDKIYAKYAAAAAITAMVTVIILSFFRQSPINIGIALFTGELIFAAGLVYINKDAAILLRVKFLLISLLCLLLPLITRYFMGDTLAGLYTGMAILGGLSIAVNYRKLFKTNSTSNKFEISRYYMEQTFSIEALVVLYFLLLLLLVKHSPNSGCRDHFTCMIFIWEQLHLLQ